MGRYVSAASCAVLLVLAELIAQICLCANSSIPCIERERQALLEFKASILKDRSNRLSSWKGTHCCQWEGIGCDNVTGHVVKLDLRNPCLPPSRWMEGEFVAPKERVSVSNNGYYCWDDDAFSVPLFAPNLNPSLLQLEYLTYLDLSGNVFNQSPIPMSIGSLGRLTYLSLSQANFGGRIPSSLGNLKNVQLLDLSFYSSDLQTNDINWISELRSLKHLDMSGVHFGDEINLFQVLNMLPSLSLLYLFGCGLDNSFIPHDAFQNMTSLVSLDLSGNRLSGPIPIAFRNLSSIEFLYLSGNNFTSIASWFGGFEKLTHLGLAGIGLNGPIPIAFRNISSLVYLRLSANHLDSVPSWFGNLKKLMYLDLSYNELYGQIPDAFRNMSSLVYLELWKNHLYSVPSWFGNLKLVYLDLSVNGIYGPIPEPFRNMTSIKYLYLSNNIFTSVPSLFGNFEKLTHLDLSSNELRGPIPDDAFQNMSSLVHLYFSTNGLDGPIPDAFRNMPSIGSLDLSENNLTSIPPWFAELKSLVYLDLSWNKLASMEYSLSFIIRNMCHLKSIYLRGNKLRGELMGHSELSGCISYDLENLSLRDNDFSGRLPTWLGQLENLKHLDFSSNFFYGPIPLSLGKLSKLEMLDLSNNKLDGALPSNIGHLIRLTRLDLSSNKFCGFIPQSLRKLVNLYDLDLSNNSFNGPIPQSLNQLVNLEFLDISSNKLDAIMSIGKGWSSNMPNSSLIYLNLSNNQISGSIPKNIGHMMPFLRSLFLGNNLINGSIPISLCQTQLGDLDLSKNNLSGEIPNCWKDHHRWEEINLSSNKLFGMFPGSFGNLSSLFWLHLNNNSLHGELPVRNFKRLLILDLGENQLSGSIPSSWTVNTFPSLHILRLRQNMLSGSIPSQLCQLTSLKILDLSRNKLEGSIPWCIGNLRGMKAYTKSIPMQPYEYVVEPPGWSSEDVKEVMKGTEYEYIRILKLVVNMDLSENNLVGSIPNEITWLTGLHGLNLSNNQFKGEIPKMIGDMKSLESLDLSHNQLSGTIPNNMPALTSLSHLNLSHNNLSGPIPKDNQFLTLDDPSIYADNPYLCGSPLPNKCPGDILHRAPESKGNEDEDGKKDEVEKVWFYFVIAIGFATGFWGVIGTLLFKKHWRHAYFRWVEDAADKIYVAIVIKVAKLKKRMMRNHVHGRWC